MPRTATISFLIFFSILFAGQRQQAQAQGAEIAPYGAFVIGGATTFYEGRLKVADGPGFGGMVAIRVAPLKLIEISYLHMSSTASWTPYRNSDGPSTYSSTMDHIQIGAVNEFMTGDLRPYGTVTLGASHLNMSEAGDYWRFSVSAGLGVKYFFSDRIGIRAQARMLMPLAFGGISVGCGIGSGGPSCGTGAYAGVILLGAEFGGGLVIRLGN